MSLVPVESGEAQVLDPVDFLQFTGLAGLSSIAVRTSSKLGQQLLKEVAENLPRNAQKELAPFGGNIVKTIKGFFAKPVVKVGTGASGGAATVAASTVPKQVTQVITKNGISTSTKAVVGLTAASIPFTVGILSLTPGGQELTKTAGGILQTGGQITQGITDIFIKNPIILIALIGLGALVVLKK